jgi:hypothetical protein
MAEKSLQALGIYLMSIEVAALHFQNISTGSLSAGITRV